jgi:hypothetical protein
MRFSPQCLVQTRALFEGGRLPIPGHAIDGFEDVMGD